VIEYRAFAAAVAANAAHPTGWQSSPLRTLAMEIEHEIAAEEIHGTEHVHD
jgi:hypothetical protein